MSSTPFPFPTEQNVQNVQNTVIPTQGNVTRSPTTSPPLPNSPKEEKKEEEKSSSTTILIASVIVGILVLGVGGYFAYKHLNKGTSTPSQNVSPDVSVSSTTSTTSNVSM